MAVVALRRFLNWTSIVLAWGTLFLATTTKGTPATWWTLACAFFTTGAFVGIHIERRKVRPRGRISVPPDPRRNGRHPSHQREKAKR